MESQSHRKRLVGGALALWTLGIVLWPTPSNLRLEQGTESRLSSAGEGLYKADLTEAGSGLLGVRLYETADGKPSWNIRSKFAELHRKQSNYAFMREVTADFFAGQSGNIVQTASDYGRSYFESRLVELEGNVVVQSQQGYRFTMDRLDYQGARRRFHSNDFVEMLGPQADRPTLILTGLGLDAALDTEQFTFRKNTRARRQLGNQEWIRIDSTTGYFIPSEERANFSGKVKAFLPNLRLESDRLEMIVGAGSKEVLKADGRVVLYHKNKRGTAEHADIELSNDKIVLEGKAAIFSDENEIRGNRITLYTDEDRVEVEKAEGSL
jgi:LPS export ABC transporter protein LptC/lipopolysaccharide transport protein LptA